MGVDASFTLLTSYANVYRVHHNKLACEEYELSNHICFFFSFFFFLKELTRKWTPSRQIYDRVGGKLFSRIYRLHNVLSFIFSFSLFILSISPFSHASTITSFLLCHFPSRTTRSKNRHRSRNHSIIFLTIYIYSCHNDVLAYSHMHARSCTQHTRNACSLFSNTLFPFPSFFFPLQPA